jgi:hypothetical protein
VAIFPIDLTLDSKSSAFRVNISISEFQDLYKSVIYFYFSIFVKRKWRGSIVNGLTLAYLLEQNCKKLYAMIIDKITSINLKI